MARIPPRGARRLQTWGPVAFFLVAVLVIGGVWFAGRQLADATTRSDTRLTAQQVRLRLEAWVDARTGLVRHMGGHRCAREHDIPAFESDATSLITASPGLLALNLVDRAGVIRVTVPRAGNERALGRDLHEHPDRGVRDALAEAQRRLVLVSSPVVQLLQGGAGLATYQPILGGDGDFLGFVNGVFRIDTLVDSCLAETSVRKHYRFRLFADDGQVAYAYDAAGETGAWPFTTTTPLRVIDRTWRLEFAPSFQTLEQRGNVFADLLALFGVVPGRSAGVAAGGAIACADGAGREPGAVPAAGREHGRPADPAGSRRAAVVREPQLLPDARRDRRSAVDPRRSAGPRRRRRAGCERAGRGAVAAAHHGLRAAHDNGNRPAVVRLVVPRRARRARAGCRGGGRGPRRDGPARAGRATAAGAEDAGGGPTCGRYRPRLQQPAARDAGLHGVCRRRAAARSPGTRGSGARARRRTAGCTTDQATADLQPAADAAIVRP